MLRRDYPGERKSIYDLCFKPFILRKHSGNIPSRFLGELPGEILEYRGISMEKGKLPRQPGSVDEFLDDLDYDRTNFNW
jgi:hypothetical protein